MVDYYDQVFRASQNVTPTNLRLDPYQAMTEARRRQLQGSPMVPGALQGGTAAPVTGYGNPPRPEVNPTIREFTSSGQPTPSLTPGSIYGGMGVPTTGYGNAPAQQVNPTYNQYQSPGQPTPSLVPGANQGGMSSNQGQMVQGSLGGNLPTQQVNPTYYDYASQGQPTPSLTPGSIYGGMSSNVGNMAQGSLGGASANMGANQAVNPQYDGLLLRDYSDYQPSYQQAPSMTPGSNQGGTSVNPLASAYREGNLQVDVTGTGVQTVDSATMAATEAKAEADKAAIDAEVTAARQAEFDAAQEAEQAAKDAEAEAAATTAGTDLATANQDAYQRNLATILESIDLRRQATGESYSDLYQQFRDQQAFQSGITDPTGIRGGMARQDQARQSAAEIGALTDLASQRDRAIREVEAERLGAESQAMAMTVEQQQMQQALDPRYQNVQTINTMLQNAIEVGDEAAIQRLYPELQRTLGSIAGLNEEDFDFGTNTAIEDVKPQLSALAERQVEDIMKEGGLPQAVTDALKSIGLFAGGVVGGATALKAAGFAGKTVAAIASKLPFVSLLTTAPTAGTVVAGMDGIGKFGLWTAKSGKLLALTKAGVAGLAAITPVGWAVLGLAAVGSVAWFAYRQHVANLPATEKEARIREIAEEEAQVLRDQGADQETIDAWVEEYMTTLRDGE